MGQYSSSGAGETGQRSFSRIRARNYRGAMSKSALIMDGCYHVDTLVRPVAKGKQVRDNRNRRTTLTNDYAAEVETGVPEALKLEQSFRSRTRGWTSPEDPGMIGWEGVE